MRLGDLEGKSVSCYIEELQFRSLLINFCNILLANIKEGIATRACSANACFSRDDIFLAGLVRLQFHFWQFRREIILYKGRRGTESYIM